MEEDTETTRLEEMLMCPVCQDIFKDPRQLPCGHSLCLGCLETMKDHSPDIPFRCPDCRADFGPVVELRKSYVLVNIVDDCRMNRKRREEQAKIVYCDCCLDKKTAAIRSCLKCEVSLCKEHIKDHLELPAFTGHPLVQPLGDLLERKCPQHQDEALKYYCETSRRYICNICALESKQSNLATEMSSVLQRQLTRRSSMEEDKETTRLEEMLMCPVCQDIFKDPRQLPCGHSLCMGCLHDMMGHSPYTPLHCPVCRADFGLMIEMNRSYVLANIVEDCRMNRRRREQMDQHFNMLTDRIREYIKREKRGEPYQPLL